MMAAGFGSASTKSTPSLSCGGHVGGGPTAVAVQSTDWMKFSWVERDEGGPSQSKPRCGTDIRSVSRSRGVDIYVIGLHGGGTEVVMEKQWQESIEKEREREREGRGRGRGSWRWMEM